MAKAICDGPAAVFKGALMNPPYMEPSRRFTAALPLPSMNETGSPFLSPNPASRRAVSRASRCSAA